MNKLYDMRKYSKNDFSKKELMRIIEKLQNENKKLEKMIDKACELIIEAVSQDCTIFDEVIEEEYIWRTEIDEWKEWCMK